MRRRPRATREPVITWSRGRTIAVHGTVMAAVMLGGFWATYGGDDARLPHARTVTFCVAAFSQLLFVFACRSERRTVWQLGLATNPALLVAVVVSVGPTFPGLLHAIDPKVNIGREAHLFDIAWIFGVGRASSCQCQSR